MDVEVEDAPHLKALDSNTFTPLLSREPIDPRIQLVSEDFLHFSPSSHPDDSLPQEWFLEYPHRCLDDIQDTWRFNGESPDGGSYSLESTPSLLISDLSPLSTSDDVSPPCTPNTFDLGELTMFPSTSIPLPDCGDGLKDHDQAALSSSALPPLLLMSLECSQVSLDPASTASLLFSSNNPNAEVYVQNDIQDGYQAPQPAGVNDYPPSRRPWSSPSGQDARTHPSPLFSPMCSPPPQAPLGSRSASAFESGWDGIQPGMVDSSCDEVDATQFHSYSSRLSLNEVKWIGGCLPSIMSLGTMGEPSFPFKHRLPVGSLVPTSSMSSMDDATTSTGYEQRRKTNPFIDSRSPSLFVVPFTSYLGDACTFRNGDMQRCQADPIESPTPSLPSLPLNKRLGDSGRQSSKNVTRTARELTPSKKTLRTSRKAKTMSQAPREGISHQSSSTINPLLATSSGLPAHNLEGGEHVSGDIDIDSSLPKFRPIGSPNIYAASKLRRKHEAKFQCTLFKERCTATFTSQHNLDNHIECHLGLLSHCSGCGKAYKHSASKNRHQKRCERVQSKARFGGMPLGEGQIFLDITDKHLGVHIPSHLL